MTASSIPFMTPETAAEGLVTELEMLTRVTEDSHKRAFLWQAKTPGLVLPERFSRTDLFGPAAQVSARAGWPVTTRKTGGGITPQGPGVLNVALAFSTPPGQSRTIQRSYGAICGPLEQAFADLGVLAAPMPVTGSFCDGDYNLAVLGRKLVGTAQRWRGNACLCHALILTDIALSPAVQAVARFSAGLGHDTVFDDTVHCRLADLVPAAQDDDIQTALWAAIKSRGFAAFRP